MNAQGEFRQQIPPDSALRGLDNPLPEQVIPANFRPWPERGYSPWRHVAMGAMLGGIAGCTSLMANVIGSLAWITGSGSELHPLRIIQVYLTFPFGESALQFNSGPILAFGCVLYLVTGMLYGVVFELTASYFFPHARWFARLVLFTLLSFALWVANFYGILIWVQPLVFGGHWITDLVPWWVAAGTHFVFGMTMALIYPPEVDTHSATHSSI